MKNVRSNIEGTSVNIIVHVFFTQSHCALYNGIVLVYYKFMK